MMFKILFVGYYDFANVNTCIVNAINLYVKHWEARIICQTSHPFQYQLPHSLNVKNASKSEKQIMRQWMKDVRAVIWAEESGNTEQKGSIYQQNEASLQTLFLGKYTELRANAKWAIFHAGSLYRKNYLFCNKQDLTLFRFQITSPDLWYLSNVMTTVPLFGKPFPVDLNTVQHYWDVIRNKTQMIVTHCPTDYTLKGTHFIRTAITRLKTKYPHIEYKEIGGPYSGKKSRSKSIPNNQLTVLRNQCHVYIDQFNASVGGIGMSTFEALSTGMIVLCTTHAIATKAWESAGISPQTPIISLPYPVSDAETNVQIVINAVEPLCLLSNTELKTKGIEGAIWMGKYFSPAAYGDRFRRQVLKKLF